MMLTHTLKKSGHWDVLFSWDEGNWIIDIQPQARIHEIWEWEVIYIYLFGPLGDCFVWQIGTIHPILQSSMYALFPI